MTASLLTFSVNTSSSLLMNDLQLMRPGCPGTLYLSTSSSISGFWRLIFNVPIEVLNYNRQTKIVSYDFQHQQEYTYSCLSNSSLTKFVEVEEKLSNTDSILGNESLDTHLNISFTTELSWDLVVALMSMLRGGHEFDLIADR